MFENYYKQILLYIFHHPDSNSILMDLNLNISKAIIDSTLSELKDKGFLQDEKLILSQKGLAFLELNHLIIISNRNKIPAKIERLRLIRVQKISLFEWAAIVTILGFIITVWLLFFNK